MLKVKLYDKETEGYKQVDLPADKYLFEVADVEQGVSKKGSGFIQVRLVVAEGAHKGGKLVDFWNLPETDMPPNHFSKNFWKDVVQAVPGCYNEADQVLDETQLKGLRFHATLYENVDRGRMQLKSYRWIPRAGGAAGAAAAAPTPEPEATKPQKFAAP